jgi:hypothetical protein
MSTSIDYSTVSHETIYQHLTGGAGSIDMVEVSCGWHSVATKLRELQDRVDQAVRGAAQQGAAAEAATHATMALIPWLGDGVTAANGMATRISEQAALFAHTRDNMPPPRVVLEVSFSQDPGTWIADHAVEWLPGIHTEHERAQVAAQQDEQRARELMSHYQGISNDNLVVRQHFTPAPTVVTDVTDPIPDGVGIGGTPDGWSAHPSSTHPAHPTFSHPDPVAGGTRVTAAPADTPAQLASGAHQAGIPQAPDAVSPQLVTGYPTPGEEPMAGSHSVRPAAAALFGPSPVLAGAGPGAAGGDRVRGGSRLSGRGGSFGSGLSSAFGADDSWLGDAPGPGGTPYGGGEPAGAGRSARSGAGWADAPLGAPGGLGRGAADSEHRRPSYLIEQDTSAIVGELPRVAPPVIGADENDR